MRIGDAYGEMILASLDNPDILFRFDVVEVLIRADEEPHLELIRNAFPLSQPYIY